jgi:hypothetical protein
MGAALDRIADWPTWPDILRSSHSNSSQIHIFTRIRKYLDRVEVPVVEPQFY